MPRFVGPGWCHGGHVLIAEDLLLLLLDDETGRATASQELPAALGGALLVELALAGVVEVEPKQGLFGSATVHRPGGEQPGDPVLGAALDVVEEKPRSAQKLVERLSKGLKETLAERQVERGVLERRDDKVLGLFPRTTWPARDATYEASLRRRLEAVLTSAQQPDERTAAVLAMLSAIDQAHKVLDHPGTSNADVRRRAQQVADGAWAAVAVKDSVQAAQMAAVAAIAAAGAAAASSSS